MANDNESSLVEPRTLKGFQDYLPSAAIARQKILVAIQSVYEKYGFSPIDTPILEHLDVLLGTGGEETNKELFRLESPEEEPVAMRFDLTVPFARLVAQHRDTLKLPFRRYHVGPVFRADKPGPGRFRQFTQCDIDAAGSSSLFVDAEIIAAACQAFEKLGLTRDQEQNNAFIIKINNRKLVDAFLSKIGIQELLAPVLRVVDKLPKVGLDAMKLELAGGRYDDSGAFIKGLGLDAERIAKIAEFVGIPLGTRREVLAALAPHLGDSELAHAALAEMEQLADGLDCLGVGEAEVAFDPSLARGLDYYTGPIFEATLPKAPSYGSVLGGGRYDRLVARFSEELIPAVGVSIGIDRLVAALEFLGELETVGTTAQVLILKFGAPETKLLGYAQTLRAAGIATEVYFADGKSPMREQLGLANARKMAVALIVGEDEIKNGVVTIKDLLRGKLEGQEITDRAEYVRLSKSGQIIVPETEMLATIQGILEQQKAY